MLAIILKDRLSQVIDLHKLVIGAIGDRNIGWLSGPFNQVEQKKVVGHRKAVGYFATRKQEGDCVGGGGNGITGRFPQLVSFQLWGAKMNGRYNVRLLDKGYMQSLPRCAAGDCDYDNSLRAFTVFGRCWLGIALTVPFRCMFTLPGRMSIFFIGLERSEECLRQAERSPVDSTSLGLYPLSTSASFFLPWCK